MFISLILIDRVIGTSVFHPDTEFTRRHIPKDADYVCFVDFKIPSAQDRLFIYDVKEKRYIYSAHVQHGNGRGSTAKKPEFSNDIGSNCSSLGMYKITQKDKMHNIPIDCFRLRGLDRTNSNAARRGIVIHPSITCTILPFSIPNAHLPLTNESQGCFAVSIRTMRQIEKYYKKGTIYLYALY